ncbi:UvrD-helicase domain-containing protein, partial [Candidatus Ichthyocystis hellenicum]|uniref:UvrD-helicase domain-containing protein n=5 Tax=Candidatus Ichthyocystis TaxID=2929841 RepID=UPI000B28B1D2
MHFVWSIPLNGRFLIEASAGTGKTWSIVSLYLRLLVEKNYTVQSILVVTYTRSAVAELSHRIRYRLTEISQYLATNKEELLVEYEWLKSLHSIRSRDDLLSSIRSALYDFDQAAIYTIHGFCQRVLKELSIDSGWILEQTVVSNSCTIYESAVIQAMRLFFSPKYWPTQYNEYSQWAFKTLLDSYYNTKKVMSFMKNWIFRQEIKWCFPSIPEIHISDIYK